jgi:ABC-type phosphate transport system auxiliary subunit
MYTSEAERKQRNRQAQAAFRHRRSVLMTELESENQRLKTQVATLQGELRRKNDQLQMVSYRGNLMERMLREKGEW